MELDQHKERASRASSTSSLGREVRCGCQYFQSDSLLPERSARNRIPPSRTMRSPEVRCREHEHEYEPIAPPGSQMSPTMMMTMTPPPAMAPVVRITDTDVIPVADSDESIDNDPGGRFQMRLILDGDIILPLDGKIEDNAMEGRELGDNDTSEEQDFHQSLQHLEEHYIQMGTKAITETDSGINANQLNSRTPEGLAVGSGGQGLPQRIRNQAGKLRSRLKNIQRPKFHFPERTKKKKTEPMTSVSSTHSTGASSNANKSSEKSPSRIDRLRLTLTEKPKFNFPDRRKFHLPDTSRFRLPERPKFNIKRPIAIKLPKSLGRCKKSPSPKALPSQEQLEEMTKPKHKIFDFSTVPRMFDKKSKTKEEYTTSSPKEDPKITKSGSLRTKWAQRFDQTAHIDDDRPEGVTVIERTHPWRHPSLEEPRLSIRTEEEIRQFAQKLPWESSNRRRYSEQEPMDEEDLERAETEYIRNCIENRRKEQSYEPESMEQDLPVQTILVVEEIIPIKRSRSFDERYVMESFEPVDPRHFQGSDLGSEEEIVDELDEEIPEGDSMHSDKEQQQSSGSSCDRRRRGIIEELDAEEFFLREGEIDQDDPEIGRYLTDEIREALRFHKEFPPQRPARSKSFKKYVESSPQRERSEDSFSEIFLERSIDSSGHRIVYQTEPSPRQLSEEPLDDIVVVKPLRKKSKTSTCSTSGGNLSSLPPTVPNRRKKLRREENTPSPGMIVVAPSTSPSGICNGHRENWNDAPKKPLPSPPPSPIETPTPILLPRPKPNESILISSQENIQATPVTRERFNRQNYYIESAPIPPKRRSRSRATSIAQDDDRTSRGAESLPEIGYLDDTSSARDLSDYAIIDKREKPPPPPPRRKKGKFATTPRSFAPKRPVRAYSTLTPARSRDSRIFSSTQTLPDTETMRIQSVMGYEGSNKDLRSGEILNKVQRRPLPAPPRPPRIRKGQSLEEGISTVSGEVTAATQTDPLPDDMVIEEDMVSAKLIVAPSRTGSQILVSTERIPTPTGRVHTPPVPPLPLGRIREPWPTKVSEDKKSGSFESAKSEEKQPSREDVEHSEKMKIGRSLPFDETLRINSLEVGDLKVDRLSVSQMDAHKIITSEIDAMIVTASELKGVKSPEENEITPSLLRELIALRSHLEMVAAQSRERIVVVESELCPRKKEEEEEEKKSWRIRRSSERSLSPGPTTIVTRIESSRAGLPPVDRFPSPIPVEDSIDPKEESIEETTEKQVCRQSSSRSRSSSPGKSIHAVRQTASPVRSLPPVISVTPDTPDALITHSISKVCHQRPQRAVISYSEDHSMDNLSETKENLTRESSQSPIPNCSKGITHYVAFPASQIPPELFSLPSTSLPSLSAVTDPSLIDSTQQLLRALQISGTNAIKYFVSYVASKIGGGDSREKLNEIELAICALLILIAGLLIVCFSNPQTITYYHHWDYFNPPQ